MKISLGKYPKSHKATRKIKVHIDNFDCWNLDDTLALIIHPALVRFKETCVSTPSYLTRPQWTKALDHMIETFRRMSDDDYSEFSGTPAQIRKNVKFIDKGLLLFATHFRSLWN
jgi:hypothetical protein